MGNVAFNISKHKIGYYLSLPAANDAIKIILLKDSGLDPDAQIRDYDTIAAMLSGNTEQTVMGRKTATGVTTTVDDANEMVKLSIDDLVWLAASGDPVGALVTYYDPDTTSSTDSTRIPLTKHDFIITPAGGDVTVETIFLAIVSG